jgi:hypothetical protein
MTTTRLCGQELAAASVFRKEAYLSQNGQTSDFPSFINAKNFEVLRSGAGDPEPDSKGFFSSNLRSTNRGAEKQPARVGARGVSVPVV